MLLYLILFINCTLFLFSDSIILLHLWCSSFFKGFILFFNPHPMIFFIDFFLDRERKRETERKRERERKNINVRETSIGCLPYVPWPEIESATFWCTGQHSKQLSRPTRADFFLIFFIISWLESLVYFHHFEL